MATVYQYGSKFSYTTERARAALSQFGRFPVTEMDLYDRDGNPFRVGIVWGIKSPEVRIILEDI